jgi:hypothetical protein
MSSYSSVSVNQPTARPISRMEQENQNSLPPFDTELPASLRAMIFGTVFGLSYAFTARVHPMKAVALLSLNIYSRHSIVSLADKGGSSLKACAAKIVAFIACQFIFKAIYKSLGMFTSRAGNLLFLGSSLALIAVDSYSFYHAYQNRPMRPPAQNPAFEEA